MADVEINIDTAELEKALGRLIPSESEIRKAMRLASHELLSAVTGEFDTSGHGTWPPHAESTIARRGGALGQLLINTGNMKGSLKASHGSDYAEVSTGVQYAVYHVSKEPRTMIPLRNFFDIEKDKLDKITENVAMRILDSVRLDR